MKKNSSNFFAYPSTSAEVTEIIISLHKKSSPTNKSPSFLYKTFCNNSSAYISKLFNRGLEEGIFPSYLKSFKVIPIFNSGKRDKVVNYRPISILYQPSKVFEKLMYNSLVKFHIKNNILTHCQSGFRSKLNISDAITQFIDIAFQCLDNQQILIAVLLDFSKAFNTVNHDILLNKLYIYSVRGIVLKCFRSYLKIRKLHVSIVDYFSSFYDLDIGVPQWSVRGPLLLLI